MPIVGDGKVFGAPFESVSVSENVRLVRDSMGYKAVCGGA